MLELHMPCRALPKVKSMKFGAKGTAMAVIAELTAPNINILRKPNRFAKAIDGKIKAVTVIT